jgi:DNA-binding GntR family transcriptional regulator
VIPADEAIAITEARMALEALIARKAAERITPADADRLSSQLATLRGALEAGDLLKYSALIQRLHESIRDVAAQPVAAGLVDRLQAQLVRQQFQLSLRPGRPQVSLGELTALVDAIVARDPDRAEAAAASHFRSVIVALSEPIPGGLA